MHVFLRSQDYEIWKVVNNGPYDLPEDENEWTTEQIMQSKLNFSTMNIMQYAIHPNEFSRVSMCSSAKEMWDNLKLIYEGTSEVKAMKANILVHEYELFCMKLEETISEMFAQFTSITNRLKVLGKEYSNMDLVRKILWSLPPAWHTKARSSDRSIFWTRSMLEYSLPSALSPFVMEVKRANILEIVSSDLIRKSSYSCTKILAFIALTSDVPS